MHNIRARGTYIKGTRGVSNGLVPMLRVFDVTSRYVDQGGGKRPGAFAVYVEPWHAGEVDKKYLFFTWSDYVEFAHQVRVHFFFYTQIFSMFLI